MGSGRVDHSCETQLLITIEDIARQLDDGMQTEMIILDFSKAFDTFPHQRLLAKLEYYGIRGNIKAWLTSWLTQRSQKVVANGQQSKRSVWDPYLAKDILELEKVQRRSARWVKSCYSRSTGVVTNLLNELGWVPLQRCRLNTRLIVIGGKP